MAARQGKCINFGLCSKADAKEIFKVRDGEEFVCPECEKPLAGAAASPAKAPNRVRILAGMAVAVVAVAGIVGVTLVSGPGESPGDTAVSGGAPSPASEPAAPAPPAASPSPASAPKPAPRRPERAKTPAPPVPQAIPAPALSNTLAETLPASPPQPPAEPAYTGLSSGVIVWEGTIQGTELVTIDGGTASIGTVLSGRLPGVAVLLQPVNDKRVSIAASPSPDNEYRRVVFRLQGTGNRQVTLRWSLP